jgi:hypothetical protein
MPPDVREWLAPGHLAWFVLDSVSAMDLEAFYGAYRRDGRSRPAYEPAMMVALLLYAYARGMRSSRAIERACEEDVAFRVIAAQSKPDHATVARFVVRHQGELAGVFGEVFIVRGDLPLPQRVGTRRVAKRPKRLLEVAVRQRGLRALLLMELLVAFLRLAVWPCVVCHGRSVTTAPDTGSDRSPQRTVARERGSTLVGRAGSRARLLATTTSPLRRAWRHAGRDELLPARRHWAAEFVAAFGWTERRASAPRCSCGWRNRPCVARAGERADPEPPPYVLPLGSSATYGPGVLVMRRGQYGSSSPRAGLKVRFSG